MEHYEWSLTWWIFRFITLGEVIAIAYLFITTWQLNKSMQETQIMMNDLLKTKRNVEGQTQAMDVQDQQFTDLHTKHLYKGPKDDFS